MKLKLLFIIILVTFAVSAFAQFTYKNESHVKRCTDYKNQLMVANKCSKDDFRKIDSISFVRDFNGAYDICARARKINIDEKFLEELNILQNVSLIRILVENGVITSISQIPEKSLNLLDITIEEKELAKNKKLPDELNADYYIAKNHPDYFKIQLVLNDTNDYIASYVKIDGNHLVDINGNIAIENIPQENLKYLKKIKNSDNSRLEIIEESIFHASRNMTTYERKIALMNRIATYALVEKYPLNAEIFAIDYIKKYGYDQLTSLMVSYFIEKKAPAKAINILDFIVNNTPDLPKGYMNDLDYLKALALAAGGDVENACSIMNKLTETQEDKSNSFGKELQIYYISGKEEQYKNRIELIKNELIIISKERTPVQKFNEPIMPREEAEVTRVRVVPKEKDENGNTIPSSFPGFDPETYFKKESENFVKDFYAFDITVAYMKEYVRNMWYRF